MRVRCSLACPSDEVVSTKRRKFQHIAYEQVVAQVAFPSRCLGSKAYHPVSSKCLRVIRQRRMIADHLISDSDSELESMDMCIITRPQSRQRTLRRN